MDRSRHFRRTVDWFARIYMLNAWIVAAALCCFMVMFAILTESVFAGLAFPIALVSMAVERDPWGLWMLSPIYLLPFLMLARREQRKWMV